VNRNATNSRSHPQFTRIGLFHRSRRCPVHCVNGLRLHVNKQRSSAGSAPSTGLGGKIENIYAGSKVPNAATEARTVKPEAISAIVLYRKALIACRWARSIRGTKT
jgi:hypothetical protein